MKTRLIPLLMVATVVALASLSAAAAPAQSAEVQHERIAASFVLALGRAPSANEIEQWAKLGSLSVPELIARHRQQLQSDAAKQRATIIKACRDAFGRAPSEDEIKSWSGGDNTYTELMKRHIQWLSEHPADYEKVMHRAYRLVVGREAYSLEFDYWKSRDTLSHALLVGCIENWARRNQPGLMVTTGTPTVSVNSEFLTTVRLSPAVAAEARAAAGLDPAGSMPEASAFGRNLVAAGAGELITGGRIHFAAAGSPELVPSGARD